MPKDFDVEVQRSKVKASFDSGDDFLNLILNILTDTQRALNRSIPCCLDERKQPLLEYLDTAIEAIERERVVVRDRDLFRDLLREYAYLASTRSIAATPRPSYTDAEISWISPRSCRSSATSEAFATAYRMIAIDDPASPAIPQACQGCQNYHGQTHGGNLLVCAIHPYGWDEGSCPDFAKREVRVNLKSSRVKIFYPRPLDEREAILRQRDNLDF